MEIVFIGGNSDILELPVVTGVGEVTCPNDDEEFKTINGITLNLVGAKGLRSVEISSFFPSKKYGFVGFRKTRPPQVFINFFEKYRKAKKPVRVIIHDNLKVSLNMLCLYEFSYKVRDRAGDVPYTLTLKEYIDPTAINLGGEVLNV